MSRPKIDPIHKMDVDAYHQALQDLAPSADRIEKRLDYVVRTVFRELGAPVEWWDYENYDGNAYTLATALGTENCYGILTHRQPLQKQRNIALSRVLCLGKDPRQQCLGKLEATRGLAS